MNKSSESSTNYTRKITTATLKPRVQRPQPGGAGVRERAVRKNLSAYELALFNQRVAKAVNISPQEKFYEDLTPLHCDEQKISEDLRRSGPGIRVRINDTEQELSSIEKLSQTLSQSATEDRELPKAKMAFPKPTFTLENAPSCRTFCSSNRFNTSDKPSDP
ncbi:uncharacterized protein LOC144120645 [Amblyomma americanum]